MQTDRFTEGLLHFLQASPTPYHATLNMAHALDKVGFTALDESQNWECQAGGTYYCIRGDSSIIAFRCAKSQNLDSGFSMIGAHTDSPGLKVKPFPDVNTLGYSQLRAEIYGGALLNPWFDRDLGVAGRIHYLTDHGELKQALIHCDRPLAYIPSLAIHLDREANSNRSVNPQTDMLPVLSHDTQVSFFDILFKLMRENGIENASEILEHDLFLVDTQPPTTVGVNHEFIASARLDNLLSCYIGLMSLLSSDNQSNQLLICTDHEEVGSQSACGAAGPFLEDTLKRLLVDQQQYVKCVANSLLISADNAHGIHPNYRNKHDEQHAPLLNHGPAIKLNANQRYSTTSETSAMIQKIAMEHDIPLQHFVTRSDQGCGSTIGPITSTKVGVKTLDMGVPQFAMHSIRELAGKEDAFHFYELMVAFYNS